MIVAAILSLFAIFDGSRAHHVARNVTPPPVHRGVNVRFLPKLEANNPLLNLPFLFSSIRVAGFDTVRLNVHPFESMDGSDTLPSAFLAALDEAVNDAQKEQLQIIIDLHEHEFCSDQPIRCRKKMVAFWAQVAQRYGDRHSHVMFELLNEPSGKMTPLIWNDAIARTLRTIRKHSRTRWVVIGPAMSNGPRALSLLQLPKSDRRILATVHYYNPMRFTHQGVHRPGRYSYPVGERWGSAADRARIVEDLQKANDWAQNNGRPMFLGEFGVYDSAEIEDRVTYSTFLAQTAECFGWSWAYWRVGPNFRMMRPDGTWINELKTALTQRTVRSTCKAA